MISVPRTLIITAGFDPLYDEGSAYANLLEKKGGKVMRLHFEDLIHGFVNLTNLRKANSATTKIFETIKKHLTYGIFYNILHIFCPFQSLKHANFFYAFRI